MKNINKNIVLIGMPGCGKSTVGKKLSKKLGLSFVDVDEYIEKKEGKTIKDIFSSMREEGFRTIETDAVRELSENKAMIISTGGGIVKNPINIELLKNNGIIIFIDRPVKEILSDVDVATRPLLKENPNKIYELYDERYELYVQYCDYKVVNNHGINHVVENVIEIIKNL